MPRSVTQSVMALSELTEFGRRFDARLESLTSGPMSGEPQLAEAMGYSLLAGGKRLRPFLAVQCCRICGGSESDAMPAALALECVHTFSLVHDDLPAMDNDDFRRGKPTCHRVFGEGMAILVGDALLTLAFELLSDDDVDSGVTKAWVRELADAVGWKGMIAGQVDDITAVHQVPSPEAVRLIHARKTARLFEASCKMGGIAARAEPTAVDAVASFGHHLGRAFQIADDLLDVTGSAEVMGKNVGKDGAAGKLTYPGVVGVEASRHEADAAVQRAQQALAVFGPAADDLCQLTRYVVDRDR